MWLTVVESLAAVYLIGGGLVMQTPDLPSSIFFKVIPLTLGLPVLFGVFAKIMGWPI